MPGRTCLRSSASGGFAGAAFAQFSLDALPVEVSQNRGHRRIEIGWNGLAYFDRAVERAGQRRAQRASALISSASRLRPFAMTRGASMVVKSKPSATA